MPETILFVQGERSLTRAVREVLRDWAAVELVSRVLWVDLDSPIERMAGLLIDSTGGKVVEVSEWILGSIRDPAEAQVVVMQIPGTGSSLVSFAEVRNRVDQIGLPGTRPVQVLVPCTDTPTLDPKFLWSSHVNVVLQPVDSNDPRSVSAPLHSHGSRFAMHSAAGIASLAGLWQGVEVPVWSSGGDQVAGAYAIVARTYFRRLDSSQVLLTLESAALPAGGQLPVPHSRFGPLAPAQPVQQSVAVQAAADSLLRKHPVAVFHPPPAFSAPPDRGISLWEAVKALFSFIASSLLAWPGEWAKRQVRKAEDELTEKLIGRDAGFRIQLGRNIGQNVDAVDDLRGEITDAMIRHNLDSAPANAASLWQETIQSICGLADGGTLPADVPAPTAAGERVVICDPRLLVVDPEAEPYRLEYGVLFGVDDFSVHPTDPLAAILLDRQLHHHLALEAADPSSRSGVTIEEHRAALGSWLQRDQSLMGRLVRAIAHETTTAIDELESISSYDDVEAQQELRLRVNASQHRARRTVLLSLLILAAVLLGLCGLVIFGGFPLLVAAIAVVVALLIWLVVTSHVFLIQQRELYQLLHRLKVEGLRRQWAADSIAHLVAELDRLAAVYRQATLWHRIFSVAVSRPFGSPPVAGGLTHRPGMLRGELPLSMAVGSAGIDQATRRSLLRDIQGSLFKVGWLDQRFRDRLDEVAVEQDLPDRALDEIWLNSGINPRDPLNVVAQEIDSPQLDEAVRNRCRLSLVSWLNERQSQPDGFEWMQAGLAGSVSVTAGAVPGLAEPSVTDFVQPLLEPATQLARTGYTPIGLTDGATAIKKSVVASVGLAVPSTLEKLRTSPLAGSHALDRIVVRIDLSEPHETEKLSWFTDPIPRGPGHSSDTAADESETPLPG